MASGNAARATASPTNSELGIPAHWASKRRTPGDATEMMEQRRRSVSSSRRLTDIENEDLAPVRDADDDGSNSGRPAAVSDAGNSNGDTNNNV